MMSSAVWIIGLLFINQGSSFLLDEDCGVEASLPVPKMVHGRPAEVLENPWLVMIKNASSFICGGTLISNRFVLTAQHCICKTDDCKEKFTELYARLGEYNRTSEAKFFLPEDYTVVKFYIPKEKFLVETQVNDIALLKLHKTVTYKQHIRPICIISDSRKRLDTQIITKFTAVGWGRTENNTLSDVIRKAEVNRLESNDCAVLSYRDLTDSQICAGTGNHTDTCKGDSGGPLYANVTYGGVLRKTQLGIISYGTPQCAGLGVYTDVVSFADWIEKTMASDITVVLPTLDLLDKGCLDTKGATPTKDMLGPSTFPWFARVYMDNYSLSYGALITDSFVLTTAEFLLETAPLHVRLGDPGKGTEEVYKVKSVHRHSKFDNQIANDIALLELERKVEFTDHKKPICLPSLTNKAEQERFENNADLAQSLMTIGWDRNKAMVIPRSDSSNCYRKDNKNIDSNQICMKLSNPYLNYVSSGSPLFRRLPYGNSKVFTLVGLASFEIRGSSQLVYTNVFGYMDWIKNLLKQ
ncbi:transmembrane protease serine 9 [Drosophila ficusphila]|uniref:transmembrane protease serine 9 n=1 Tax=Drosophila ficusphila TaxID=30025 RepID=UPI0007E5CF72|nr:transmembrane protease serine 9 [Drosophila ficusphila]